MPRPAAITQPEPPADPHYPPPVPIAPIVRRRFEQDGRLVAIVRHQEITCCGERTLDDYYTAVVGAWEPEYEYQFTHDRTRPRRTVNWRTTTTTRGRNHGGELLTRKSVAAAVRAAKLKVHEMFLAATYDKVAQEVSGVVGAGTPVGPKLDAGTPGQVVVAEWGHAFWYAVIAEVADDGRVTHVVLNDMPPHQHRTRVLRVGRHVRALHAPPGV